jgi:hypothetical protein
MPVDSWAIHFTQQAHWLLKRHMYAVKGQTGAPHCQGVSKYKTSISCVSRLLLSIQALSATG